LFAGVFSLLSSFIHRRILVPRSLLEAIKLGNWEYEPAGQDATELPPTPAMPGSKEKLAILAERLRLGLPLWHESDRRTYNDQDKE
jgi:hypothetical protein